MSGHAADEREQRYADNWGWCYTCGDLATGHNVAPIVYRLRDEVSALQADLAAAEAAVELQRHEYGDLLRRAEFAEAKVARVEALSETYETVRPSRPKWDSVASNIRAALRGDE